MAGPRGPRAKTIARRKLIAETVEREGLTVVQAEARFGLTGHAVKLALKTHGVKPGKKPLSERKPSDMTLTHILHPPDESEGYETPIGEGGDNRLQFNLGLGARWKNGWNGRS